MTFSTCWQQVLARTHVSSAGQEAVLRLLAQLGNPHQKYKIIHVAGTNGKGSVCTLLAGCLSQAGEKTGLFISPHLQNPCERISIDGHDISPEDFSRVLAQVFQAKEAPLNFFEILTVAAFLYFAQKQVSYVVLETGLGGAKDPTNVCTPILSVITSIGLDHTHLLGNSLEQIAAEKGGIIKQNTPVFVGDLPAQAHGIIRQIAHRKNAPLYQPSASQIFQVSAFNWADNTTVLSAANADTWPLHMLGSKQAQNAALVRAVCDFLNIPVFAQKQAFQSVSIKCRFEVLSHLTTHFILDGAHNAQAVESFISLWKQHPAYPRATLLFAAMKDKDYQKMLSLLAPHVENIILTQVSHPRAVSAHALAQAIVFKHPPIVQVDLTAALAHAHTHKWVLCVGSFYLAGAVRTYCTEHLR